MTPLQEFFGIFLQYAGLMAGFGSFIYLFYSKLDDRFKDISLQIRDINQKHDDDFKHINQRSDQLYTMFIDLLKEKK